MGVSYYPGPQGVPVHKKAISVTKSRKTEKQKVSFDGQQSYAVVCVGYRARGWKREEKVRVM